MPQQLPLPHRIVPGPDGLLDHDAIQANFEAIAKQFPLSRRHVKLEQARTIGDTDEPVFENSWVNFDASTWQVARFWVDSNDMVHLEGYIKSGVVGSRAFVLPSGYRPALGLPFIVLSNNAVGRVDIAPTGDVVPVSPSNNTSVSLNGITFRRAS